MQTSRDDRTTGETRVVETPTQARQGVTGHNVRYVLLFGTALFGVAAMRFRGSGC